MPEPHLRSSDADRVAVATALGEHMAAGRLTLEEYDDRLARAYAAKTYGQLDELTTDLPPLSRRAPSAAPGSTPAPASHSLHGVGGCSGGRPSDPAQSWRSWLHTALIVLTVWAATSLASWELHYFWPMWVIGPWGAVLLVQSVARNGDRSSGTMDAGRESGLRA